MAGDERARILQHEAEDQHRLARGADFVHRRADLLGVDEAGAGEAREIHGDGVDAGVGGGGVEPAQHIALAGFAGGLTRQQPGEAAGLRGFLDHGAIEFDQQRAIADAAGGAAGGERRVEHAEEQQQQRQHHRILDADEQFPQPGGKGHGGWGLSRGGCVRSLRAMAGDGPVLRGRVQAPVHIARGGLEPAGRRLYARHLR